jgi:D-threo-aldose 1-dehydrogenase
MNKRRIGSTALEFTEVSFGGAALGGLYRLFARGGDGKRDTCRNAVDESLTNRTTSKKNGYSILTE